MSDASPAGTDGALARAASETAGCLRALVELMESAGWRPDGYTHADLREVAAALGGMSMRAAMASDDNKVVEEVMGPGWKRLDPWTGGRWRGGSDE